MKTNTQSKLLPLLLIFILFVILLATMWQQDYRAAFVALVLMAVSIAGAVFG